MNDKRQELFLSMLASMADSQRALARMLNAAAAYASLPADGGQLVRHIEAIAGYQRAMADKLAAIEPGLLPRTVRRGSPGLPWLSSAVRTKTSGAAPTGGGRL